MGKGKGGFIVWSGGEIGVQVSTGNKVKLYKLNKQLKLICGDRENREKEGEEEGKREMGRVKRGERREDRKQRSESIEKRRERKEEGVGRRVREKWRSKNEQERLEQGEERAEEEGVIRQKKGRE